jgi:hypothetical protein
VLECRVAAFKLVEIPTYQSLSSRVNARQTTGALPDFCVCNGSKWLVDGGDRKEIHEGGDIAECVNAAKMMTLRPKQGLFNAQATWQVPGLPYRILEFALATASSATSPP